MTGPQIVAAAQAVLRGTLAAGKIRIFDYFGGASPAGGAQAYLVEQTNHVTPPHFHPADQFQVLFGAPGSLFGQRPVGALAVHYADANSVYGPLAGGEPPLRYLTLRARPTTATYFMPESRILLPGRGGRRLHCELDAAYRASRTVLEDQRDGLKASYLAAGSDAHLEVPAAGPGGQFFVVVTGAIESAGIRYGPGAVGWQPPGSPVPTVQAAHDDAGVLVLRYPVATTTPKGGPCEHS